ncbi:MAG: hypothetical protein QOJ91_255 [Sphingomonadales bacterium]|jgi:hypothetical protein|nr:hypothetical protein [Sphingomonadales bacterium]
MSTNPPAPAFALNPPPVSPTSPPPLLPTLPASWQATAILHPFGPWQPGGDCTKPFFELCIANLAYLEGGFFSAQLLGSSGRTWWYIVDGGQTFYSTNQTRGGSPERPTKTTPTNWALPGTTWLTSAEARYFASGPLNWMKGAPSVDWWTQPASAQTNANAATWIWVDSATTLPVRMMFGAPPPTFDTGTLDQLALFQNFSFTYFPTFSPASLTSVPEWSTPSIPAFNFGQPPDLEFFVWNSNFGMAPMMTPVNAASNPLPTQVHYHWTPDEKYQHLADRAQVTQMSYQFNSTARSDPRVDTVVMYGGAPTGMQNPPPFADQWVDYTINNAGFFSCTINPGAMAMGAEAPNWVSTPGEKGTIWATIDDDPVVSPNNFVALYSVLFPPSCQYPNGRFLWTWYSRNNDGSNGVNARPVVFMESASSISEGGTSLALADYYDYKIFADPIPPGTFSIPVPSGLPITGST